MNTVAQAKSVAVFYKGYIIEYAESSGLDSVTRKQTNLLFLKIGGEAVPLAHAVRNGEKSDDAIQRAKALIDSGEWDRIKANDKK